MHFSQKSLYALRAMFELAQSKSKGKGPVRIADVAESQDIPKRFLEGILAELRKGGYVESHRGRDGGYTIAEGAESSSVGEILRFIEGPFGPVQCICSENYRECQLRGSCVFEGMWRQVRHAMLEVLENTTLLSLMEDGEKLTLPNKPSL